MVNRSQALFGAILVLFVFVFTGCAPLSKTIILRDMPHTLAITKGNNEADKHCDKEKRKVGGCALRDEVEDTCTISLSLFATVKIFVHELAHCAGYDEEAAQAIADKF